MNEGLRPRGEIDVLVRAGNTGEWLQLLPIDGLPQGGFRTLCGADAATMLELDTPLPVAAFGPWPAGSGSGVDAVCLTDSGDIELVVATFGERPADTLWRLVDVASTLRGTSIEAFTAHCTQLRGEQSVAAWLQQRVGGDVERLEARLEQVLETGDVGFVIVTSNGAGDLAQPLQLLQRRGVRVRVFEVEVLRAGDVQAIEGVEVPLGSAVVDAVPAARTPAPVPAPVPVAVPVPQRPVLQAVAEPEPEQEPEAVSEAQVTVPEPIAIEPSSLDAFLACVDRLDHRTSAHLRWLHEALLPLADEIEYTRDGELEHVAGWMRGSERVPLFGLDSAGLLQLVLSTLPEHEQLEYAREIAGLLPDADGEAFVAAGIAEVDIPEHLDDQTLIEYLVDNLIEALPGGREVFGTTAEDDGPQDEPQDEQVDENYFAASVSEASPEPEPEPDPEPEPEPEPAPEPRSAGSRWLRRRGAA
jgi:hypothetical protein